MIFCVCHVISWLLNRFIFILMLLINSWDYSERVFTNILCFENNVYEFIFFNLFLLFSPSFYIIFEPLHFTSNSNFKKQPAAVFLLNRIVVSCTKYHKYFTFSFGHIYDLGIIYDLNMSLGTILGLSVIFVQTWLCCLD